MTRLEFNCMPTIIGSMPHKDAGEACRQVLNYLRDIPAWPQLPKRSFLEDMAAQYIEGFPGVVIENEKYYVDRNADSDKDLEKLYMAYLENDFAKYPISPEHAAGLYKLIDMVDFPVRAVKGQITGPVTLGMTLTDNDGRTVAYDDILADALAKMLKLRAAWMEKELKSISDNTIIFLDEPYLTSIGSSFFALSRERVVELIEETFSGISGVKGMHCCGNSDWGFIMSTSVQVLSFDTYNYVESLALYPQDVKKYITDGRAIAWGVVPNDDDSLAKETAASLQDRLEEAIAPFTRNGVDLPFKQLIAQGLITPSCGVARLSEEAAEKCMGLLKELSDRIRSKYA